MDQKVGTSPVDSSMTSTFCHPLRISSQATVNSVDFDPSSPNVISPSKHRGADINKASMNEEFNNPAPSTESPAHNCLFIETHSNHNEPIDPPKNVPSQKPIFYPLRNAM
ncbi:unnamed protein product [Heterobilharzia americana]|nr:unnamed protein product [Heterobilharzia americana]